MDRLRECKAVISPGICFGLAFWLLILPVKWVIAMIVAASFHELCHYLAICALGGQVYSFKVSGGGAEMRVSPMQARDELICTLAGPIGGLALLFAAQWIPRIAICAAAQSIYNLIPVYPLDGGRALHCGALMLLPADKAERVCFWAGRIALGLIGALALYGTVWRRLGLFPVLLASFLILKSKCRKTPCNAAI